MYLLAYKKPPEKAIFRQRQFVRYVKGKEICIRVINGDIKMRIKKRRPDYGAISRRSIKNDFKRVQRYPEREKRPQIENPPEINAERRVLFVGENSGYYKLRSFIVGKLVRLVQNQASAVGFVSSYTTTTEKR